VKEKVIEGENCSIIESLRVFKIRVSRRYWFQNPPLRPPVNVWALAPDMQ